MDLKVTKWYDNGLRFQCTGCGKCCCNHSEYTYVYLIKKDIEAIARFLKLSIPDFLKKHCTRQEDGLIHLNMGSNACPMMENNNCIIYNVRPKQCQGWPFWLENLSKDTWQKEVAPFCPGVGKGKLYSAEELEKIAQEGEEGFNELIKD
ncbi:MAG: YkgJ family cysteine cluster protein [bacterium]|nr:YkgJ family cysteine cluster protein [bacterium]